MAAVETYELVEAYPDDKYLPSYIVLGHHESDHFHALFAADVDGGNVQARRSQVAYAQKRGVLVRRACALLSVARSTLSYESRLVKRDAGAVRRR